MQFSKKTLNNSVLLALFGTSSLMMPMSASSAANLIPDGPYIISIQTTPQVFDPSIGAIVNKVGNATIGWNSSFSFGKGVPATQSQAMFDNGNLGLNAAQYQSSVAGDGFAGTVGILVSGNTFTVTSFQVDTIAQTAGGNFAQYGTVTGGGTIDQTTGAMVFTPTGRMGGIDGAGAFVGNRWNVQVADEPTYRPFTTGITSNVLGSITGRPIVNIGDVNGDTINDYSVTLVSSGQVGSDWGVAFVGQSYIEVWKADIRSIVPDTVPSAFAFSNVTGVATSTLTVSNPVTVSGINSFAPISVVGGEYSINGGTYTAVAGTVTNGQPVRVRHTTSAALNTAVTTSLNIGGVVGNFTSTTQAVIGTDTIPDAFSFTNQTNVPVGTITVSNTINISGIDTVTPISVMGGEYSANGGPFTTVAGTVTNGQTIEVRHTSSGANGTSVTTTLTIGGVVEGFTSTTVAAPVVAIPTLPPAPNSPPVVSAGGGGCAFNPEARFDPTLIGLLFAAIGYLGWKCNQPKR